MTDHRTILTPVKRETEIKHSRFIAQVCHVTDETEIEGILAAAHKKHYKATHICYAYVLSTTPERKKSSDDGEPSGTAGKPILEVIERRELKDVLVLVIRYFGGIKLGAGGLIRAYAGAAANVIDNAQIILRQNSDILSVSLTYPQYALLSPKFSTWGHTPVETDFGETVTLDFYLPPTDTADFSKKIKDATCGQAEAIVLDQTVTEIQMK